MQTELQSPHSNNVKLGSIRMSSELCTNQRLVFTVWHMQTRCWRFVAFSNGVYIRSMLVHGSIAEGLHMSPTCYFKDMPPSFAAQLTGGALDFISGGQHCHSKCTLLCKKI